MVLMSIPWLPAYTSIVFADEYLKSLAFYAANLLPMPAWNPGVGEHKCARSP